MKKINSILALSAMAFTVACSNAPEQAVEANEAEEVVAAPEATTENYTINTDESVVEWIGFKTYSDDQHTGIISVSEGNAEVEAGNLIGGSFTIDMNSIDCKDLEGEYKGKLEGHLKNADFFDVENHSTAVFTITGIEAVQDTATGTSHVVAGNLMLRGIEKNISIPANISIEENTLNFMAPEFVINRTDWEVNFHSTGIEGVAKDQLIDNNIKLTVAFTAHKS